MKTLEALDKYLRGKKLSPRTVDLFTRAMTYLSSFEVELPMSRALLNEWVVWMSKNRPDLRDITIKLYSHCVHTVYNYLADVYEWEKNPARGAMKVEVKHRQRRYFTPEELIHILNSCQTDFEKILIGTLLDSSCRVHELAGLKTDNVFDSSFKCRADTKTGEHIYRCRPEICQAMRRIAVNGYVFTNSSGQPSTVAALRNRTRWILIRRAGMTGVKLGAHTFRHSAASLIAAHTGSVLAVQSVTGHADAKMAQAYIHDVNQRIAQRYSPLELAGIDLNNKDSAAMQTSLAVISGHNPPTERPTEIVMSADGKVIATGSNWLEDMFKPVGENSHIRPELKTEDMQLIRHALQLVVEHSQWASADMKARDLWTRMTRRT